MMEEDKFIKTLNLIEKLSTIKLRSDPVEYGLSDINEKLAEVTNKKSNATILSNKITYKIGSLRREMRTLKSIYEIEFNKILSTDIDVLEAKFKDQKMSIAKSKLVNNLEKINDLHNTISKWEDLDVCIQNCLSTLKVAKETLSRQLSVIKQQIEIGEISLSDFQDIK